MSRHRSHLKNTAAVPGRLAPDGRSGAAGTPRRRHRSRRTRSRRCTACRCRDRCTAPCRREGTRRSTRRSCTGRRSSRGTRSRSRRRRCGCARDGRRRRRREWRSRRARRSCSLYTTFSCERRRSDASLLRVRHLHTSNLSLEASPQLHDGAAAYRKDAEKKTIAFCGAHVVDCAPSGGRRSVAGVSAGERSAMDFERLLSETRVIPVVEIPRVEDAVPLARALAEARPAVRRDHLPHGRGGGRHRRHRRRRARVSSSAPAPCCPSRQAEEALAAGARFLVSPGLRRRRRRASPATRACPMLPGVCTPTEIVRALAQGVDIVKFFPAEAAGGVDYLKAVAAPFGAVRFVPDRRHRARPTSPPTSRTRRSSPAAAAGWSRGRRSPTATSRRSAG